MAATLSAKQALQQRARELGFDDCRCTTADPPAHAARFQRWLDAGRHGEMGYLARNAHKRIDPSQVLAHARTIITLAASYIPPASFAPAEPGVIGEIARYARFSDYHNVLGRRLKSLAAFLDSLVPDVPLLVVCRYRAIVGAGLGGTSRDWVYRQAYQSHQPQVGQLDFPLRTHHHA